MLPLAAGISQKGTYMYLSVPTSLQYPATNLYSSLVDFV